MNSKTMQYKGYTAMIEYSDEEQCLIGEVLGISHGILFRGDTHESIYETFKEMIEFYLKDCAKDGIKPCKPPKEFSVTFSPEVYAEAYKKAENTGIPIQTFMETAIRQATAN